MKKVFRKKTITEEAGNLEEEKIAEAQVETTLTDSDLKQEEKEFESFFSEVVKKLQKKHLQVY